MPRVLVAESAENARIARRLKAYRILAGLTQAEVGDELDITDVQVQKYENGRSGIKADHLVVLARLMRVSVLDLLGVGDTNEVSELVDQITETGAGTLLRHYRNIQSPIDRGRLVDRACALASRRIKNV